MITLENNQLPYSFIEIKSKYELTLESWLSKFVDDEVYPDYSWDNCNNVTNCIMKTKISLLPKYLIIQLMRFESVYTATQTILTKNNQFVEFPIKGLDLSNIYKNDLSLVSCIYDLYGVIHHFESIKGYQYYATINCDVEKGDWYEFKGNNTFGYYLEFIEMHLVSIPSQLHLFNQISNQFILSVHLANEISR